jgi:peroxiredoxin
VCGDQLALYNELADEFANFDIAQLAISVEGVWCHLAFAQNRGYHLMLLSDFEPKGELARRYGVCRDKDGFAERALFVLKNDSVIQWSYVFTGRIFLYEARSRRHIEH